MTTASKNSARERAKASDRRMAETGAMAGGSARRDARKAAAPRRRSSNAGAIARREEPPARREERSGRAPDDRPLMNPQASRRSSVAGRIEPWANVVLHRVRAAEREIETCEQGWDRRFGWPALATRGRCCRINICHSHITLVVARTFSPGSFSWQNARRIPAAPRVIGAKGSKAADPLHLGDLSSRIPANPNQ